MIYLNHINIKNFIRENIIGKQGGNDNVLIDNSEKIANEFNNFFVSISHNLVKYITCNVNPMFYVNSVNDSIVLQYVSVAQVRNIITSLNESSPAWDHLFPFVMKQCVDTCVEPITVLINNSFYHGIFPDELKLARVVPIFKSGDLSKIYNYRPISISLFFSKIYERLMYNNVFNFINEQELISKYLFGFRQKHSTQQAIILLVDKITKSLDSEDIVIRVFFI